MNTFRLEQIARVEFHDIVEQVFQVGRKMRITIQGDGYLDVWHSGDERNRYKYHWIKDEERGEIFRHDNTPDKRWQELSTFPKHFHDSREDNVKESHISDNPDEAVREMLAFIRARV